MVWPSAGRWIKGLGIAAVTWMVLGSVVGLAAAANEQPLPATFALGPMLQGDLGVYENRVEESRDGGPVEVLTSRTTFQWGAPTVALGNDRVLHTVNALRVTMEGDDPGMGGAQQEVEESLRLGIPGKPAAIMHREWTNETVPAGGLLFPTEQENTRVGTSLFKPMYPCGVLPSLPSTFDPRKDALDLGYCDLLINSEGFAVTARDVVDLDGRPTLLLEGRSSDLFHSGMLTQWWMAPGLPYPLQIRMSESGAGQVTTMGGPNDGDTREFTFTTTTTIRLVALSRGTEPLAIKDVAQETPVAAPALASWQPWGVDETGIVHPFSLRTAYEHVIADEGSGVPGYLRDHQEAYLGYAEFFKEVKGPQTNLTWQFAFTDGDSILGIAPTLVDGPARYNVTQLLPVDLFPSERRIEYGDVGFGPWFLSGPPPKSLLPTNVTTATALVALWHLFRDPGISEGMPDGWGFYANCVTVNGVPCAGGNVHTFAGTRLHEEPRAGEQLVTPAARERASVLSLTFGRIRLTESDSQLQVASLSGDGADAPPATASTIPTSTPTWTWPAPRAIAGAGLLAVLAGLAYALAPSIKGMAVGLFSRMAPEEALEHPERRRILDLVTAVPGIHFQDLRRRLQLPTGTLVHHLDRLEKARHVSSAHAGGRRGYFARGAVDHAAMRTQTFLRSPAVRAAYDAVQAQPGVTSFALSQALGCSPSTASHHLGRLAEAGLVVGVTAGRERRWHPVLGPASQAAQIPAAATA